MHVHLYTVYIHFELISAFYFSLLLLLLLLLLLIRLLLAVLYALRAVNNV